MSSECEYTNVQIFSNLPTFYGVTFNDNLITFHRLVTTSGLEGEIYFAQANVSHAVLVGDDISVFLKSQFDTYKDLHNFSANNQNLAGYRQSAGVKSPSSSWKSPAHFQTEFWTHVACNYHQPINQKQI